MTETQLWATHVINGKYAETKQMKKKHHIITKNEIKWQHRATQLVLTKKINCLLIKIESACQNAKPTDKGRKNTHTQRVEERNRNSAHE